MMIITAQGLLQNTLEALLPSRKEAKVKKQLYWMLYGKPGNLEKLPQSLSLSPWKSAEQLLAGQLLTMLASLNPLDCELETRYWLSVLAV